MTPQEVTDLYSNMGEGDADAMLEAAQQVLAEEKKGKSKPKKEAKEKQAP